MTYRDEPNERQPLLPQDAREEDPIDVGPHQPLVHTTHSPNVIIAIIIAVVFCLQFAGSLMQLPNLRIYEDIICHRYYEHLSGVGHIGLEGKIDEGMCKGDEIQNELNIILGVEQFITAIPGMLMVVPYGLLADKIGRKPVFILVLIGFILTGLWSILVMWFWKTLPLRLVWLAPVFQLIGGGNSVAGAVFYAIASDVTTEETRSYVFLIASCSSQLGAIMAPTIAAVLMARSPWIPMLLGYFILVASSFLMFFVPETLHLHAGGDVLLPDEPDRERSPTRTATLLKSIKSHVNVGVQKLRESASILTLPIGILLFTFVGQPFSTQADELFPRYVSKRFSWTLAKTGYLLSLRSASNIILLIGVLPAISHALVSRFNYTSRDKDFLLARFSIFFLLLGALCITASPTISLTFVGLIICTFGSGFTPLCRAIITTLVDKEHVARLYAAIAVVETGGTLVASPLLAWLYSVGLKMKGPFIALPFFFLSVIFFLVGLGVWFFGLLTNGKKDIEPEYESQAETAVGTDDDEQPQYTV